MALRGDLAASPWSAATTGTAQIEAALAMLRASAPPPLAGHLAGITILIDHHREITAALVDRADLIVDALGAFAAAWPAIGSGAPRVVWRTVERLARHASALPAPLVALLPALCDADHKPTREAALALALRADLRDEVAAIVPADATPRHPLRRALAALDAARQAPRGTEAVLARALAAWRETRDPALLPWIALADRDCARDRDPLVDADHERWLAIAVANDPADTARLLDAHDRSPTRTAALARRALHPRYAQVPELASLLDGASPRAAAPALLAALERELAAVARKWDLLDEHVRKPSDLGLRGVLADVLVEAGDPQGELITLQSALADGVAKPGAANRVKQLVAQHAARLIGPLPAVDADRCRFERGFLVAVRTKAGPEQMRAVVDHPAWATVEELGCDYGPIPARLPLLRRIEVCGAEALAELAHRGPHPHVELIATWPAWVPPDRTTFPNLRVLAGRYEADELASVAASGIAIAVVYHIWRAPLSSYLAARGAGPPILRLSGGTAVVSEQPHAWQIEIVRGADFAHVRAHALWHRDEQDMLQELARYVHTIYVHTDNTEQLHALAASGTIAATLVETSHDVVLGRPTGSPVSQQA